MTAQALDLRSDSEGNKEGLQTLEYALDIKTLSKSFKRRTLSKARYTTLKSFLLNIFRRQSEEARFTNAIENLTLRIPKGASVGIIGKNGSGKSTLLKLITGIYRPDRGSVAIEGRVAALIELGAGFHPDFTGRENLYLSGIMHGLTKSEVDKCFDSIVKFAELEAVIDDPVRTYSSGMFMRLGFSVAVHTNPDILMIDEVLAVGDAAFVVKCRERIAALRREGKTLLLVSHDLDAVERWCDEVLWLHEGKVKDRGDPRRVIDHYREFIEKGEERELFEQAHAVTAIAASEENQTSAPKSSRWGSREVEITAIRMWDSEGSSRLLFHPDDYARIEIDYAMREEVKEVVFGISINRSDGVIVHGSNTDIEKIEFSQLKPRGTIVYHLERISLLDGSYSLDVAVHKKDGYPYDYHKEALKFAVRWPLKQVGVYLPQHRWEAKLV